MATILFGENPVKTSGELPASGSKAPPITLIGQDMGPRGLDAFAGKKKILNIFPASTPGSAPRA